MLVMIFAAASLFPADAVATASAASSTFWNQPIDIILYDVLVGFGWIPIVVVLLWGFIQVWLVNRQGKWVGSLKYVLLAVDVPATTEQSPKALENMFASLWGAYSSLTWKERWIIGKTQPLFSFEIGSREGYIQYYVRVLTRYRDVVEAGIYAVYPEAEITEVEDYTAWAPTSYPHDTWDAWGTELKLKEPNIFPIRTFEDFEDKLSGELKDPLAPILEQLAKMRPGEHFWIQLIIQPNGNDWKKEGAKFINKIYGIEEKHKPGLFSGVFKGMMGWPSDVMETATGVSLNALLFGAEAHEKEADPWKAFKLTLLDKEMMEGVIKKVNKVGYSFKLRLVYLGKKGVYDKQARTAFVKGMFTQYAHLNLNAFGLWGDATPKDDYFWQAWTYPARQGRLVGAFKRRSWGIGATPGILNAEELATLWHFPAIQVKAPLVKKSESRRAEPPVGLQIEYEEQSLADRAKARTASHTEAPPPPVLEAMPHGTPHIPQMDLSSDAGMHLPGIEKRDLPTAPRITSPSGSEEVELGLDATDMGPPADIVLPGPPPGWKPEDDTNSPPNLPV